MIVIIVTWLRGTNFVLFYVHVSPIISFCSWELEMAPQQKPDEDQKRWYIQRMPTLNSITPVYLSFLFGFCQSIEGHKKRVATQLQQTNLKLHLQPEVFVISLLQLIFGLIRLSWVESFAHLLLYNWNTCVSLFLFCHASSRALFLLRSTQFCLEVFSLSITNPNGRPILPFDWFIHSDLILASTLRVLFLGLTISPRLIVSGHVVWGFA